MQAVVCWKAVPDAAQWSTFGKEISEGGTEAHVGNCKDSMANA
jgi:hypothetical protein